MDVTSFNLLFALLALAAMAGALVGVLTLLVPAAPLRNLRLDIAATAPWFAFAIAAVATAGSLYYSEVAGFTPCKLCWFQRILMYPLALLLPIGLLRRDRGLAWYVVPLALLGGLIALYHVLLQKTSWFKDACAANGEVPCSSDYIYWLGFITIPVLALTAFVLILLAITAWRPAPDEGAPWAGVIGVVAAVAGISAALWWLGWNPAEPIGSLLGALPGASPGDVRPLAFLAPAAVH